MYTHKKLSNQIKKEQVLNHISKRSKNVVGEIRPPCWRYQVSDSQKLGCFTPSCEYLWCLEQMHPDSEFEERVLLFAMIFPSSKGSFNQGLTDFPTFGQG